MKFKLLSLFLVLSLALGMGFVSPVQAVGYGTSFVTSVTYMNVGTTAAQITVDFYEEGGTTVKTSYPVADLAPNAAASLGVGTVFTTAFKGSAVMSSSQPLVATMVQVPQGTTTVKNRPLSNGFSAGSTSVLIPTVLKGVFNTNSIFSVQNAGTAAADVSVHFIPATAGTDVTVPVAALAPGAAKYFDMGAFTQAGTSFNGSVSITSAQPVVASSMELSTTGDAVYAFEGTSGGAKTLYMPSAMCNFGPTRATSFFAIQNTGTVAATSVKVTYTGKAGTTVVNTTIDLGALNPGAKVSAGGCGTTANPVAQTFLGAAVVTADQPVVAIAKISGAGAFVAAHSGVTGGAAKLAAPYVRYTDKYYPYTSTPAIQQANIAVQNVGTTEIPAGQIKVTFVNTDGTTKVYTYASALAAGAKFSVNPKVAGVAEFGYQTDASGKPIKYGGGALIEGPTGSQLAAVVRITSSTASGDVAEDYNALPAQ